MICVAGKAHSTGQEILKRLAQPRGAAWLSAGVFLHKMHNLHNGKLPDFVPKPAAVRSCACYPARNLFSRYACMTAISHLDGDGRTSTEAPPSRLPPG